MLNLAPMDFKNRSARLQAVLGEEKLDALLVSNLDNIRWLSGFSGSAARLVVTEGKLTLVTDGRYSGQAEKETSDAGAEVEVIIENAKQKEAILSAIGSASNGGTSNVGLEADDITWATFKTLESDWFGSETDLVPTTALIGKLRRQKDAGEIARIQKAAEIADQAYEKVSPLLAEHPTEKEVARELEAAMLDFGAEGPSFETIVATGDHSAWAHARPQDRQIEKEELILIDMGALVEGYHSDMTRTSAIGLPSKTSVKMYEVVEQAQQAGLNKVKAGVRCADVDEACREIIEAAGWGSAFNHSTGHGVGLNIHEHPRVSNASDEILLEGEVVTVEPGVYISPHGGVRIEDTVLVTAEGCDVLTKTPKELIKRT